jgi:hypothetical protein
VDDAYIFFFFCICPDRLTHNPLGFGNPEMTACEAVPMTKPAHNPEKSTVPIHGRARNNLPTPWE